MTNKENNQKTVAGKVNANLQRIDALGKTALCMSIQDELANAERKAQANIEARDQAFIAAGAMLRAGNVDACVDCLSIASFGRNVRLDVDQRNFING